MEPFPTSLELPQIWANVTKSIEQNQVDTQQLILAMNNWMKMSEKFNVLFQHVCKGSGYLVEFAFNSTEFESQLAAIKTH